MGFGAIGVNSLLSFGHGYSARALEQLLAGWNVIGTNRSGVGAVQWPTSWRCMPRI